MAAAAVVIEFFSNLGLMPQQRSSQMVEASIGFNDTTVLNIIFSYGSSVAFQVL